jgi:hypothetical protein
MKLKVGQGRGVEVLIGGLIRMHTCCTSNKKFGACAPVAIFLFKEDSINVLSA